MPVYPAAAWNASCASPGCWCRDRRPRYARNPQNVHELVREVVLAPFPALERDGRADLDGREREHGEDHPLGPAEAGVQAEGAHIWTVVDTLETRTDLLGDVARILTERGRLVEHDAVLDLVAERAGPFLLRLAGQGAGADGSSESEPAGPGAGRDPKDPGSAGRSPAGAA